MKVWLPAIRSGSGTDIFTRRLQEGLAARGIESLITWFPLWTELIPQRLRLARIPAGVDVIHANGWIGASFVGRGIPVVATVHHLVHDPDYARFRSKIQSFYHRWHLRNRELRALHGANAITAVSGYVARTVKAFGCPQQVYVVPNWVDTDRFTSMPLPRTPGPFRLLLPGNRTRRKGFELLPSLAAALGTGFELRCTSGLRGRSDGDLAGNIVDLGRLTESQLITEYQKCDAVVSLSRYEGFGYTAVEAMACGKPFVGFRTSGLAEVVPTATGYLAPVDDIDSLASYILALSKDCTHARTLGSMGRKHVLQNFTDKNVSEYIRIYEYILLRGAMQPGAGQ